jgi:hypothetical protein
MPQIPRTSDIELGWTKWRITGFLSDRLSRDAALLCGGNDHGLRLPRQPRTRLVQGRFKCLLYSIESLTVFTFPFGRPSFEPRLRLILGDFDLPLFLSQEFDSRGFEFDRITHPSECGESSCLYMIKLFQCVNQQGVWRRHGDGYSGWVAWAKSSCPRRGGHGKPTGVVAYSAQVAGPRRFAPATRIQRLSVSGVLQLASHGMLATTRAAWFRRS